MIVRLLNNFKEDKTKIRIYMTSLFKVLFSCS